MHKNIIVRCTSFYFNREITVKEAASSCLSKNLNISSNNQYYSFVMAYSFISRSPALNPCLKYIFWFFSNKNLPEGAIVASLAHGTTLKTKLRKKRSSLCLRLRKVLWEQIYESSLCRGLRKLLWKQMSEASDKGLHRINSSAFSLSHPIIMPAAHI